MQPMPWSPYDAYRNGQSRRLAPPPPWPVGLFRPPPQDPAPEDVLTDDERATLRAQQTQARRDAADTGALDGLDARVARRLHWLRWMRDTGRITERPTERL